MTERIQINRETGKQWNKTVQEPDIVQMAMLIGNQAMMQCSGRGAGRKRKERDGEFKPDLEIVRQEEITEEKYLEEYYNDTDLRAEDVPAKLTYVPEDKDCYKGIRGTSMVHIDMQGSRKADEDLADDKLYQKDISYTAADREGYTWHHMVTSSIGSCSMVLVKTDVHRAVRHIGAVHQYVREKRKTIPDFKYG